MPPHGCVESTVVRRETDNLRSIQTWALEEARRRLEAEGILEDPEKKQ
jgi:hypothetical protein